MTSSFQGVAQLGRVLALDARSYRFKSCHPDHMRIWHNGCALGFQSNYVGSIPTIRSIQTCSFSFLISIGEQSTPQKSFSKSVDILIESWYSINRQKATQATQW